MVPVLVPAPALEALVAVRFGQIEFNGDAVSDANGVFRLLRPVSLSGERNAVFPAAVHAQRAVYVSVWTILSARMAQIFRVFAVLVPVPASEAIVAVRLEYIESDFRAVSYANAGLRKRGFALGCSPSGALGGLRLRGWDTRGGGATMGCESRTGSFSTTSCPKMCSASPGMAR